MTITALINTDGGADVEFSLEGEFSRDEFLKKVMLAPQKPDNWNPEGLSRWEQYLEDCKKYESMTPHETVEDLLKGDVYTEFYSIETFTLNNEK